MQLDNRTPEYTERLEKAFEDMTSIIQNAAYDRCDYCTMQTEPCPSRGINIAPCCFEYLAEDE